LNQTMGIFNVVKAAAAGAADVAEPEPEQMALMDMIVWRMTNVPRDGTSLLFCMAMSLSICFVMVLAIAQFDLEHVILKEKSVEQDLSLEQEMSDDQEESEQEPKETVGKIINPTEEQDDDMEDETVSNDDSKPFDEPPTPTMSPPTEAIVVKEADKHSSDIPVPSIPDMSPSRVSGRRLTAKAKSFGGSIRRLGKNEYTSKFNIIKKQRTKE